MTLSYYRSKFYLHFCKTDRVVAVFVAILDLDRRRLDAGSSLPPTGPGGSDLTPR